MLSTPDPVKDKPKVVSMESHLAVERAHEARKDAWVRASRSIQRHDARHEWRDRQAKLARERAEKEALHQASVQNQVSTGSNRVSLSGIAACIAKYESGGNPRAQNPNSTASGLYQFIDGTWNNYGGYSRAMYAPVSIQTEKFYQLWDNGRGAGHWVVAYKCGY